MSANFIAIMTETPNDCKFTPTTTGGAIPT